MRVIAILMITTNRLVENLDPRAKIVSFLAIILCIILTPITRYKDFQLYFLLILSLTFFSGTTVGQVFKRACVLIPFILAMALFVPFLKEGQVWGLSECGLLEVRRHLRRRMDVSQRYGKIKFIHFAVRFGLFNNHLP